jgi:hypothetical protein
VEQAADLRAGIERCIASVNAGRASLLEVVTQEEATIAGEH